MNLCLALSCLHFQVMSLHIAQHFGRPEQAAISQMDNATAHQLVPQSHENANEPHISWMSQDSLDKLEQVRVREGDNAEGRNTGIKDTSSRFVLLPDSPTAVVYLTYRDDQFHHCQAGQLNTAFGKMFHTVSVRQLSNMPGFLPAGSIAKGFLNISDADLYKLNDMINKEHGKPSEGAVNLAHALILPLIFPEIKYLWIIEDDFVFDGDSIKRLVNFHNEKEADYMPVLQLRYDGQVPKKVRKLLKPLRFNQSVWRGSFAPVMRLSARFVRRVADEMLNHGFCFFEPFFPTVAAYYNLTIKAIDERFTKNIRWLPEWTEEEMASTKKQWLPEWTEEEMASTNKQQAQYISIFHPFKGNQVHIIPACSV